MIRVEVECLECKKRRVLTFPNIEKLTEFGFRCEKDGSPLNAIDLESMKLEIYDD